MSLLDADGESLDRTRAPQWHIWHYGRYPWSSEVTDPCKEPTLLVHFDLDDDPDTVQLTARNPHPPLQARVEYCESEDIEQRAESEQHVLVAPTYSLYERSE
ncbi:hypothetical protein V8E54_008866 [Elaphomyces granulatus]